MAGPRGRGAADTDTDTDSGNGSGNGAGPSLLLKHRRPLLCAVSDLGGLSSLPSPSPPVRPWPFIPPAPDPGPRAGARNGSSGPVPAACLGRFPAVCPVGGIPAVPGAVAAPARPALTLGLFPLSPGSTDRSSLIPWARQNGFPCPLSWERGQRLCRAA